MWNKYRKIVFDIKTRAQFSCKKEIKKFMDENFGLKQYEKSIFM